MVTFVLLLLAAICFGVLAVHQLVTNARAFLWLLPLGLLLWVLVGLLAAPLPA